MAKIVGVPKELAEDEKRVALTPETAGRIHKLGYKIQIEKGAGEAANFSDDVYADADVEVVDDVWETADIIMKVRRPTSDEAGKLGEGKTLISFLQPGENEELLDTLKGRKPNAVLAMDQVPRISRAQKLDALSSMANIAGYRAVVEAANNYGRFFTGQVTAAGKVPPAKILVVGAGVAGLAAIGAASSMGAIVRAFDIRPEVAEQIESMGAEFLMLDFEDQDDDDDVDTGYAKPSSPEFREKQLALFKEQAPDVDIVITTALIPGKPAPKLWTEEMVNLMRPGSVVVDLAAEQGGNCELTKPGERIVTENDVIIVGYTDMASRMAAQSSQLYGTNLRHLLDDLTPEKDGEPVVDMEDDVIRGMTAVKGDEITYPPPKISTSAAPKKKEPSKKEKQAAEAEKRKAEEAKAKKVEAIKLGSMALGAALLALIGFTAPREFMAFLTVFVLAVIVGYYVIWNVSHSLHTPLMAVTNAISGIIVVGALLQISSSSTLVQILAAIAVFVAFINISGGFLVTRRMLSMFEKSED